MLAGTLAPLFEFNVQLGQRLDEQTPGGRETGAGRMGKIAMIRADINNPPSLIDLQNFDPSYKSIKLAPIMKREAGERLWQERTTFQVKPAHRTAGQDIVSNFLEHVHIPAFQVSKMDDCYKFFFN
jgi:hypothetical protein